LDFGILGPVQVLRDGSALPIGGPRQRGVLVRLLLDPGHVVPFGSLIDDVWGGDPPPTATVTLQKYVSQLRKTLGADVLTTAGGGYAVNVPPEAIDAARFERLLKTHEFDAALAHWRGQPLAGLPDVAYVNAERTRLEELRLVALEGQQERRLAAGHHLEAVADLHELTEQYPTRERFCGLLMIALYRSGRQSQALAVYQRHRQLLIEEVGVEPAEELAALQQAILRHDAALVGPPASALELGPATDVSTRSNIRLPVSSFIGRADDHARVVQALTGHRLVTLIGPGGIGKTRLATEVAGRSVENFAGGVWFVELSGLDQGHLVANHLASQVANALGISGQRGQPDEETLLAALQSRERTLLVLDNCEHVVAASASLADRILRTCPAVSLLVTSRCALGVDAEQVVPVNPLSDDDAYCLFADRTRLGGVAVDDAAEARDRSICQALDGLPLALELAASQQRILGPLELSRRLDDRLQFVSRRFDAAPRQRSLRDMVEWSFTLVPPAAQDMFIRLGVFATTMTLDGVEAVCGPDELLETVSTLVDHSLLIREPVTAGPVRFRMLDTLRLFALEKLRNVGGESSARRAHAEYYLRLARQVDSHLYSPDEPTWVEAFIPEGANLHAALCWAENNDRELALDLGIALWRWWDMRWREQHAIEHFTSVLDHPGPPVAPRRRAWSLAVMADLAANPGEARNATAWATEAVELFRGLHDDHGLAVALNALGSAAANAGALAAADQALAQAMPLAKHVGDSVTVAKVLDHQAFVATRRGEHQRAVELSRAEYEAWSALGSRRGQIHALRHTAVSLQPLGEADEAAQLARRALDLAQEDGDEAAVAHVRSTLADIARMRGDIDEASTLYAEAFGVFRSIGDRRCTSSTYKNTGVIASAKGDHAGSTALLQEAVRLRFELGDLAGLSECFVELAVNLASQHRVDDAQSMLATAHQLRIDCGTEPSADEVASEQRAMDIIKASIPRPRGNSDPVGTGSSLSMDEAVAFVRHL
jgi:predicted ATPase/DNA-binding SARP family transcriptional activator